MTPVVALDGVTSYLHLKDVTNTCICGTVQLLAGFPQCNGGKLEEAEYFKCVFLVNGVLHSKIDQLLSNTSLFVSQLYEDKSLSLSAHDMSYYQTVNYHSTIHC